MSATALSRGRVPGNREVSRNPILCPRGDLRAAIEAQNRAFGEAVVDHLLHFARSELAACFDVMEAASLCAFGRATPRPVRGLLAALAESSR